jgi:putative transposase
MSTKSILYWDGCKLRRLKTYSKHVIDLHKTASLMVKANIVAILQQKRHYYPKSGQTHKYAPNLLKREFNPTTHNTHWVVVLLILQHIKVGVIWPAFEFRNALAKINITASVSRRGNCCDNAIIERFFKSLKTERLNAVNNHFISSLVTS